MTTFQGTDTFLLECSRENSAIDDIDDENTNGSWSNETSFNIERGDRISVEMICANIRGSGTGQPTLEFTGQNVSLNGKTKGYCDTKVLLEVFFYMSNQNTHSVGLPLIHPRGGINGKGRNTVMPTNLNPRTPTGNVTNQINNYREINRGHGYVEQVWNPAGTKILPYFYNSPYTTPIPDKPVVPAYQIYQYQVETAGVTSWLVPGLPVPILGVDRIAGCRILPFAATQAGSTPQTPIIPKLPGLFTDFENGVRQGRTGESFQNCFYEGNHVFISNGWNDTIVDSPRPVISWLGQIESIKGTSGLGAPAFGVDLLELSFFNINSIEYNRYSNMGLIGDPLNLHLPYGRRYEAFCADCAVYVGSIEQELNPALPVLPATPAGATYPMPTFNLQSGSGQEGLINYDNLNLETINLGVPANPVLPGNPNRVYKGDGYFRGNNGLFLYARNTRKPQLGQNADLNLFPETTFDPIVQSGVTPTQALYTVDAGESGDFPAGAEIGYRNANIEEENNNEPYIFMRNDCFGAGRRDMNGGRLPLAEPMTAFIYISIEELLQDVNSVTAIINERLKETIQGIGTSTEQTSKFLLNSLENPADRKPASNVTPYYTKVGFYDADVTQETQNVFMNQPINAQYRDIITDIIPIKNGGCIKVNPANFTSGRDFLTQSIGKQYGGIPSFQQDQATVQPQVTQSTLDTIKKTTYLREIDTSKGDSVINPDIITPPLIETVYIPEVPEVPAYTTSTPQPDLYTPEVPEVPAVPESTIIYNSTADGSVALVSDFDVANNVSPMTLGNGAKLFTDDGGLNANYSTSHSRHATFDAGAGNHIYINPRDFDFEHSSYSMYDRLGITCSNTVGGLSLSSGNLSSVDSTLSQYLYQSSNSSPSSFWGTSWVSGNGGYGSGGGWIFPNTAGVDVKGNNNSGWINTWYKIDARYVRFWFKSDGSATEPGWDILVARAVVTPAVPAIPAVPGFYTPQPDIITNFPAIPAIPGYTTTTTTLTADISGGSTYPLVEVNYNGWANPIYGNMATADLYKYQLGDRMANLPIDKCNTLQQTANVADNSIIRDVGKIIILNNKLQYVDVQFYAPDISTNFPLPSPATSKPLPLFCNELYENQVIYTNIEFPTHDTSFNDFKEFAKSLRKYETYYNPSDTAPVTYDKQLLDTNGWIFDGDVGNTDDTSSAQLRKDPNQPGQLPPVNQEPVDNLAPEQPQYEGNRPFVYDWLNQPTSEAFALNTGTSLFPIGAIPVAPLQLPPPVPAVPVINPNYRRDIYNSDRMLLCPTTSAEIFAGVSQTGYQDEFEKYKMLKDLGRLKIKSRFNPDYKTTLVNFANNIISGINSPVPLQEVHDTGFKNAIETEIDTSFVESLDLPFYPYRVKNQKTGEYDKTFVALVVGTNYQPDKTDLRTINFGGICWGNTIGISNMFMDNHAIVPMNNDQVKRSAPLNKTSHTQAGWRTILYQDCTQDPTSAYYPTDAQITTGAYTQTTGILAGTEATFFDITENLLVSPYLPAVPAAQVLHFRLTCSSGVYPSESNFVEWTQPNNINGLTAGAVTILSHTSGWTNWQNPPGTDFNGLHSRLPGTGDGTYSAAVATGYNCPFLLASGSTGVAAPNSFPNPGTCVILAQNLGGVYPDGAAPVATFVNQRGDFDFFRRPQKNFGYGIMRLEVYKHAVIAPTVPPVVIPVNLGLQYNKVNYVWTGASNPTFQYDTTKGRVEFINLQEDNIINQLSIPYDKGSDASTANSALGTGQKAGIINTACEDAVFSRNTTIDDVADSINTTPVKNSGIRAEIGGVGIYNIFLCPEEYEPPNNINLSSYWNNSAGQPGEATVSYWGQTKINRDRIIKNCVEADKDNWANSLFSRLGFQNASELLPIYGKQNNRFNPTTYNKTKPIKISRGTKPLILSNAVDNTINPALNSYFTQDPSGNTINGVSMYSNGFLNDESVALELVPQPLTASSPPILSTSPFLLVESDICQTNYRSGRTQQNVMFYLMKNYQASSFIYGYGSSYSHTANQDRTISLITTSLRDPITGRLQKCSNNSTILYKIQRDIVIPPPTTSATGVPLIMPDEQSSTDKLLEQILYVESGGKEGGGGIGVGSVANGAKVQEKLINSILQTGGMTNQIVEGEQAALHLAEAFTAIRANVNIPEGERITLDMISYIIQQIFMGTEIPISLTGGEYQPDIFTNGQDGLSEIAGHILQDVEEAIEQAGGLTGIASILTDNPNMDAVDLLDIVTTNPQTGRPMTFRDSHDTNGGFLQYLDNGGESLASLAQAMYGIIQITDDIENGIAPSREDAEEQQQELRRQAFGIVMADFNSGTIQVADSADVLGGQYEVWNSVGFGDRIDMPLSRMTIDESEGMKEETKEETKESTPVATRQRRKIKKENTLPQGTFAARRAKREEEGRRGVEPDLVPINADERLARTRARLRGESVPRRQRRDEPPPPASTVNSLTQGIQNTSLGGETKSNQPPGTGGGTKNDN